MYSNKKFHPCLTLARTFFVRNLWVPIVWTVVILMFSTVTSLFVAVPGVMEIIDGNYNIPTFAQTVEYTYSFMVCFVISVIIAAVFGSSVFNYLSKTSSASFIHGLPLSRKQVYFSYCLSSVIIAVIPNVFLGVVAALAYFWPPVGICVFYVGCISSLVAMFFGIMISQFTAKGISATLFSLTGLAFPFTAEVFFGALKNRYWFGYSGESDYVISEHIYLMPDKLLSPYGLIYVAFIAIFVVIGYCLFSVRNAELAGDLISIPRIRKPAVLIASIVIGVVGGFIFSSIPAFAIISLVACVLLGVASRKKFTFKGALFSALASMVVTLVLVLVFVFDITGYEKRIPFSSTIESACVKNGYFRNTIYVNGEEYLISEDPYVIRNREDIEKVRDFHRYIIKNRKDISNYEDEGFLSWLSYYYKGYGNDETFVIEYKLKNGKTLSRYYSLDIDKIGDAYREVAMLKEVKTVGHDILRDDLYIENVKVQNCITGEYLYLDDRSAKEFTEAMKKDIINSAAEVTSDAYRKKTHPVIDVDISAYYNELTDPESKEPFVTDINSRAYVNISESIYPQYTETIKFLSRWGGDEVLQFPGDGYKAKITKSYTRDNMTEEIVETEIISDPAVVERIAQVVFESSSEPRKADSSMYCYKIVFESEYKRNNFYVYGADNEIEAILDSYRK